MTDKEKEYLSVITPMFLKYGFRTIGVDDISKELGISKKTLYQTFKDKADIIQKAITRLIEEDQKTTCTIVQESENAIDEIIQTAKHISRKLEDLHPVVYYEAQKYYSTTFKAYQEHKKEFVFKMIKNNIERGVQEGLFRENVDTTIIAALFVHKIDLFIDRGDFEGKRFSFKQVYFEMIRYHIRGLASEKGRAYLKERIKQEEIDI